MPVPLYKRSYKNESVNIKPLFTLQQELLSKPYGIQGPRFGPVCAWFPPCPLGFPPGLLVSFCSPKTSR